MVMRPSKTQSAVIVAAVCAAATTLSAQGSAPPAASTAGGSPQLTTYTGCVEASSTRKNTYTMSETETGPVYVLKGMNGRDFVGKRVEVTVKPSPKLVVKGGLYPNANVAAQAGSMDPARAAIETMKTGPYGNEPRPTVDIEVRSARIVQGDCPAR